MPEWAADRRLLAPLGHPVDPHNPGNQQTKVAQDFAPAGRLRLPVSRGIAPSRDRRFVAPEREGDKLVGIGEALKSLDGNEAVHLLQLMAQARRMIPICGFAAV